MPDWWLIGSTNSKTPLIDAENRRFPPVMIDQPIDLDWIDANRNQLLAEAAHYEAQGDTFAIPGDVWDAAAEKQEEAREPASVEALYERWFADRPLPEGVAGFYITACWDVSPWTISAARVS
jgi:predicted P-loop ATPase